MLILYIGKSPRYKLRSQLIIQNYSRYINHRLGKYPQISQNIFRCQALFNLVHWFNCHIGYNEKALHILKGTVSRERWPNDGGHFGIDWFQNIKHSKLDTCATIFCTYLSCSLLFFMPTISILNKVEKIIMYVSRCSHPPF